MDNVNNLSQTPLIINQQPTNPLQTGSLPNILTPVVVPNIQMNPLNPPLNVQTLAPVPLNPNTGFIHDHLNISEQTPLEPVETGEDNNEKLNNDSSKKGNKHGKRRSKSEIEGRNFVCKLCDKSYLSYPALYTHCKQKHNTNNSSGRGRGRPKKEIGDSCPERNKFNPLNSTFFSKENRTGTTEPKQEINECIEKAFKTIYEDNEENKRRNNQRGMKFYTEVKDHPFLGKFLLDQHDTQKQIDNENLFTDLVLINYLNKMSVYCNPEYYVRLIVFVTLFREHVNKVNLTNKEVQDNSKDFTEDHNAEDFPDSSNEFITDFLDPEGRDNDFGFSKDEAIDLTQNLCFWMYENNFTCSKLSLIHSDK